MEPIDPDRNLCAFEFMGRRCRYPGSCSESTTGSARWYCGGHFRARDQATRMEIFHASFKQVPKAPPEPTPEQVAQSAEDARAECKALLSKFTTGKPDTTWQSRLLKREAAGETLGPIQIAMLAAVRKKSPEATDGLDHLPYS
jgi:hypothetical protein